MVQKNIKNITITLTTLMTMIMNSTRYKIQKKITTNSTNNYLKEQINKTKTKKVQEYLEIRMNMNCME